MNLEMNFGHGFYIVDTGTYMSEFAVFIKPSRHAGVVGTKAPKADQGPCDQLEENEIVMTFPTKKQADAVADAIVGATQ